MLVVTDTSTGSISLPSSPLDGGEKREQTALPLQLERAYTQIRRLLYLRVVSEGQRLHEVEWSRRLNVNRSAMREAMARLAAEGLLMKSPGKGYAVPKLDPESLEEAVEMRILLETEAVRRICRRGLNGPQLLERLEYVCDRLESLADQGYCLAVQEADWRFHQLLVTLSGNPRLSAVHAAMPIKVALGGDWNERLTAVDVARHAEDHRRIVHALRAGDAALAEVILRTHFARIEQRQWGTKCT